MSFSSDFVHETLVPKHWLKPVDLSGMNQVTLSAFLSAGVAGESVDDHRRMRTQEKGRRYSGWLRTFYTTQSSSSPSAIRTTNYFDDK